MIHGYHYHPLIADYNPLYLDAEATGMAMIDPRGTRFLGDVETSD